MKLLDSNQVLQVQRAMLGVKEEGTARGLSAQFPTKNIAAKTGTTNEARDSWFTAFTSQRLSVIWMGLDDNAPLGLTGSSGAMKLWSEIMKNQRFDSFSMARSESLEWHPVDPILGGLTKSNCANSVLLPIPADLIPARQTC